MTTLETEAKQSMGKSFALTVRASTQVAMDIVAVVIPFSSILIATRCPKITRKLKWYYDQNFAFPFLLIFWKQMC